MITTRRNAVAVTGTIATVLLHVLFLSVAIVGSGQRLTRLPDAIGAGANSGQADGMSTERMILIRISSEISNAEAAPVLSPRLIVETAESPRLEITGPDVLPPPPLEFEDEGTPTEASESDLIARTRLAGLYESQIRARIERGWAAPVEEMKGRSYFCQLKIRQHPDGRVADVLLDSCEGSQAWLDSLVKAVYSASPLPGAPHPAVYVDSFSMIFRAR